MARLARHLGGSTGEAESLRQLLAWMFHASSKGLALVKGGRIVATNPTFDEINQFCSRPEWVMVPTEATAVRERFRSLREVVLWHSFIADADCVREESLRFRHGDRVVECRFDVASGTDDAVLAVVADVTRRARAEEALAAVRARAAEQEAMQILGEVAAGVGHDLSNVLTALSFRVRVLVEQERARGGVSDNLEAIGRITQQSVALASKMQALSRPTAGKPTAVDLREVVDAAIAVAGTRLRTESRGATLRIVPVRIDVRLGGLPAVHGHADELQRVFINLLLNARDAMPDGGTISVRGRVSSSHVVVSVEDEGSGIRPEHLPRLFDMRFTTKGAGGSGVGLAVVKKVMESHGGAVSARNRRGRGACFELRFPVAASPSSPASASPGV